MQETHIYILQWSRNRFNISPTFENWLFLNTKRESVYLKMVNQPLTNKDSPTL